VFLSRTLNNAGTVRVTSTSAFERFFFSGGTLNNQNGGLFDLRSDRGLTNNGGTNAVNNSGTFRKSVATGSSNIGIPFNNAGIVDIQTGTLSFSNGGTSSGAFNAASATTLEFGSGTHTLQASSTINAPTATVVFSAGTATLAGAYTAGTTTITSTVAVNANLTFPVLNLSGTLAGTGTATVTGTANWTGGSMTGSGTTTIGSGATLNVALGDSANVFLSRTLNNAGTAIVTSTSAFERFFFSGATLNNQSGGLLDLRTDRGLSNNGGTNALTNSGTLRKSVGTGTSAIGVPFTNAGFVEIQTGALSFTTNYVQTAGMTRLIGGNLNNFSLTVNIQGGILEGAGTITGNLSNAGTIRPGSSAGCLSVSGNYTQTASGSLEVEIGGPSACSTFDQLQIGGTATLGGSLTASLIGNFAPSVGQPFQVMTFASRSGTFASVNGPFTASYNAGNVTLTADAGFAALGKKKK
jgi:hypothetical protein